MSPNTNINIWIITMSCNYKTMSDKATLHLYVHEHTQVVTQCEYLHCLYKYLDLSESFT